MRQSWSRYLETFLDFSKISLYHKRNGTRKLSLTSEHLASCQMNSDKSQENLEETLEILGPASHPSVVKHSKEKPILLNFVHLSTILRPGL